MSVVPRDATFDRTVEIAVTKHEARGVSGHVALVAPEGVSVTPSVTAFSLAADETRFTATFRVVTRAGHDEVELRAHATVGDETIVSEYLPIRHDDLESRYLDRPASATIRFVDLTAPDNLAVGYVMGVGDEIPAAIQRLGATVRLLDEDDLATGDLSELSAIVVGTRAYAVRPDLVSHNHRLMEFAASGGHVIVMYQTQEFVPERMAPYPAVLPRAAEEVSQEDAPVTLLAPDHALLSTPNRLGPADFDGWIEQRGSKFFSTWSREYVPLIETNDTGQPPQRGVWLSASVGDGHYTYVALALHRQLPYGVAGAYRILANVLALGVSR